VKIVVPGMTREGFFEELREEFPEAGLVLATTEEEQKAEIVDADAYLSWPSRDVFLAAKKLRWVHVHSTGVESLALRTPELIESDVVFTNTRGPHDNPIADHALAMMLFLGHKMGPLWDDKKARRWDGKPYFEKFVEMNGSVLGILGLGGIGSAVARRGNGFGMKVYAVDKFPKPIPEVQEVWTPDRIDELLPLCDWFVVTSPLTSETRGFIDRRRVGLLKHGAFVIVVSRGNIVDEEALAESLQDGRLRGAGIDAFAKEPLPQDSPLWGLDNVMISPHNAGVTPENWEARRQVLRENLKRFLNGEPFLYVVDKKAGF